MYLNLLEQLEWRLGIHVVAIFLREIRPEPFDAAQDSLSFRLANEAELLRCCEDPSLDLPADWARAALARGDQCIGAFDGDVLAGYVWTSLDRAPDVEGVWVQVPPMAVYRYKCFVRPAYRGRNVAPRLYHCRNADELARGRSASMGFIHSHNRASIAAARKSGSRPVGWVVYRPRAPGFFALHSPGVRRLGMRFFRP